jgi:glycosyltransferase involved in cell wall biosynthesis
VKTSDIHVTVVCPACGSGGSVANIAIRQAQELAKHFSKVTLISESFPNQVLNDLRIRNIKPKRFYWLKRFCHVPNEYAFDNAVLRALTDLHKNDKITLILFHGHSPATIAGVPMKQRHGIPYALVTHGDIFDRPAGTYDRLMTAFYKKMTPLAYRNADLIVALSPSMAECALRGGARKEAIVIIPNGIDPAEPGLGGEASNELKQLDHLSSILRLLYVGTFTVPKGVDVLIDACNMLKSEGIHFSLSLVGAGPLELQLRQKVETLNLQQEIRFIGKIGHNNLGEFYQNADLVCVPSINDPLPTVVLEALVRGTPVVASDVGGIPFMIKSGYNGVLVPSADPKALADAMRDIAIHRETLDKLASNVLDSVFPRFSWSFIGERLRDVIVDTVKSRAGVR